MRHTVATKFLAFLLAACALVAVFVCGGYALMLESYDLYDITPREKEEQWYYEAGYPVAWRAAAEAAAMGPGECSQALAAQLYGFSNTLNEEHYYVTVWMGEELVHTVSDPLSGGFTCKYTITPQYPKVVNITPAYPDAEETTSPKGSEQDEESLLPDFPLPDIEPVREEIVDVWEDGQKLYYELYYYDDGPTYTVSVTMMPSALRDTFYSNLTTLFPYRYHLIWGAAIAMIFAAAAVVYLIFAAGRAKDGSLSLGGLNRLPLDAYALLAAAVGYFPFVMAWQLYSNNNSFTFLTASLAVLCCLVVCMLILAVVFALSAQVKLGGGYWWRHSWLGRAVLIQKGWLLRLFGILPVIWQWLLVSGLLMAVDVVLLIGTMSNWWGQKALLLILFILACAVSLGVIAYGGYCFGVLLQGAKKMAAGEISEKIPTDYLRGSFRVCAEEMNILSETADKAVQSQVRSERMKTELITNVSHDIKTPLTSIINFVDLLGKPHSQVEEEQYLEVLSRQSQQLKKLIEDLMELSKASTGNMTAHIISMDAAETVNQALGEFADKLEKARLTPVFHAPKEPMMIAADGRLTWRVLSNLLSNTVKYATPETRIYLDLTQRENTVQLSVKNVSKEELRYSAEELMERFVRGDASRNREGSGLGLNIAKSLMEVQHGSLELVLDGDLFKVILTFPMA